MPIDFLSIKKQIPEYVKLHYHAYQKKQSQHDSALSLLQQAAEEPGKVIQAVKNEIPNNEYLRCAFPFQEKINETFPVSTKPVSPWLILAIDGSQIIPDPHSPLMFGLINIGIFTMPRQGIPEQEVYSELQYTVDEDELQIPNEEKINYYRDIEERKKLVDLSYTIQEPNIALTDGPLSIFREPDRKTQLYSDYEELVKEYEKLPSENRIVAGYIDRPRSSMVIKMLNIWSKEKDITTSQLSGFQDEDLFSTLIPPGNRSAVFALHNQSARLFKGEIGLHFFYLNVSRTKHPSFVRVEIPAWVAKNKALINQLHYQLLQQCQILGDIPYPYVLHRAHEIAIVHFDEKDYLNSMMMKTWLDNKLPLTYFSPKQLLKNLSGARRRRR